MTYEMYWYGDPWLIRDYIKAEEYRREKENYNFWLQGLYMAQAINSTIGNAFTKEGSPPMEYPEKPFSINEAAAEDARKEKEEKEVMQAELYMRQFIDFGKNWGKKPDKPTPGE